MTTTYCIVRQPAASGTGSTEATASLQARVARSEGRLLHSMADGVFVELDDAALKQLRDSGADITEFGNPHELRVGAYRMDVRKPGPMKPKWRQASQGQWRQFVAQFKAPPEGDWLRDLESRGLRVSGRLGQFGVMLEGDAAAAAGLAQDRHIAHVAPFEAAWRISPNLKGAKGRLRYVSVLVSPASALPALVDEVKRLKGRVEAVWDEANSPGVDQRVLIAELDAARLLALAGHRDVRWLDVQPPSYEPEDERSVQIVAGNLNATAAPATLPVVGYAAQLTTLGIDGAGVVIAINDTGVDTNTTGAAQADLAGRIAFAPAAPGLGDTNGHGTHVAGIAAGNGATTDVDPGGFRLGQGVAPGARIGVLLNPAFGSIAAFSQTAAQSGSHVMNCSWGVNGAGAAYSILDQTIDQAIRDADAVAASSQALAVVFSAGNAGSGASTLTKQTKNAIVVGNSLNARPGEGAGDDIRGIATGSSRGPAADGRLLPTVIAPGTDIISCRPTIDTAPATPGTQRPRAAYNDTGGTAHTEHYPNSGTSMASPHVAGLCALLIEWWRDRTGGRTPSPAMLKALVVNGAVDCAGGPDGAGGTLANIPNNQQGWGRANLRNIVLAAPDVQRGPKVFVNQRHAFTANGQTFTLRVAVADATRPLRVTLAWTDSPGNPASATMLVNDLDLRVTEVATGRLFLGNVFANGFSTTGGTRDQLNNVECVYVQVPTGGYDVTVRATSITLDARPPFDAVAPWQDFALVVDNAERAASAPVSAVTVLDRSGSMISSGYVDVTRTAARTVVDLLRVGDDFGLVSFGSTATLAFASAGAVVDIAGAAQRAAARAAIDAIAFGGATHMGPGLAAGAGLLSGSGGTGGRGIVLLSDGYDNGSPSAQAAAAALPAGLPVYSCAMGPLSDQVLLEQIASTTGGRYYFMPTIDDLFEIHNYISATLTGTSLVANESAQASSSHVDAWVDRSCAEATFTVTWADPTLKFRADAARKPGELCVRLRLPNGKLLPPNASVVQRVVGQGNVLLRVDEPAAGRWRIEVSTGREAHTRYTAAAYVDSPLKLWLAGQRAFVKLPFDWAGTAEVRLGKDALHDVRLAAMWRRPTVDLATVLKKFGDKVKDVPPIKGTPKSIARLRAIVEWLRKKGQPYPFTFADERLAWRPQQPGSATWVARAQPVLPGSYNVVLLARGQLPGGGGPFVRKHLASFVAA